MGRIQLYLAVLVFASTFIVPRCQRILFYNNPMSREIAFISRDALRVSAIQPCCQLHVRMTSLMQKCVLFEANFSVVEVLYGTLCKSRWMNVWPTLPKIYRSKIQQISHLSVTFQFLQRNMMFRPTNTTWNHPPYRQGEGKNIRFRSSPSS
jgi:hypothetical protein